MTEPNPYYAISLMHCIAKVHVFVKALLLRLPEFRADFQNPSQTHALFYLQETIRYFNISWKRLPLYDFSDSSYCQIGGR